MSDVVLLLGIGSEPPLELTAQALGALGLPYRLWDQRDVLQCDAAATLSSDGVSGWLRSDSWDLALEDVCGVYTRLTDWSILPALEGVDPSDPRAAHAAAVHDTLERWLEITPARVVNPARANDSNNSKPFQSLLIRSHFFVPDTLVTTDPNAALAFCQTHERAIYKSISGERSVVTEFTAHDVERLALLRYGPVQFQEWVDGYDVRVHVVGDHVFATRVHSGAIDYRYDRSSAGARFVATALSPEVEEACVALSHSLGLPLAGLDLRFASDGRVFCFEVNPSPAFSAFESQTGQPISRALAWYLAGVTSLVHDV